jgi:exodeoxyribonuclease V beta subunit
VIADETEWEKWLTRFEEYRLLWLRSGFISMARKLVSREQIKPRLGALPDGERRLTNLLHLLELLHRVATQEKMGVEGLLKWLNERRQLVQDTAEEEHQIRLETDELAVKIVTIHKSKGLEYPITFCPFLWGDSRITQSVITYHDKEENYQSVVDVSMTPDETTIECAETEQLAENIRLTYVALTRAKYRCYAAWGYIKNSETSALAYLLHGRTLSRCDLAALETHMKSLSDDALTGELRSLAGRSQGAIELLPVPEQTTPYYFGGRPIDSHGQVRGNLSSEHGEREGEAGYPRADGGSPVEGATRAPEIGLLRLRPFTGQIERDWRVSSFSALTSGKDEPAELPDRDSQVREEPPATGLVAQVEVSPGLSIFTFPAGAKAGSCLHEIFQYLDFARFESEEVRGLVTEKLARYGFAADWVDTVCLLIKNVLTAPLDDERSSTLSALGPDDRLREVEFHVPLELITPEGLGSFFASSEGRADPSLGGLIKRLGFKPVRGMLKGYIDLVFRRDHRYYIVDWKSNYLGASPEDYARERLMTVMEREFYTLQYHVYAVALHRFLELRLPDYDNEKHFGGVYYLFLRGMGPTGEYGVFFDRPAPERISALAHYLTGR